MEISRNSAGAAERNRTSDPTLTKVDDIVRDRETESARNCLETVGCGSSQGRFWLHPVAVRMWYNERTQRVG